MKEKYVKPAMVIEHFTLTSSIARNCADFLPKEFLTQNDMHRCAWDAGGGYTVFAQAPVCIIEANEWVTDAGDIICYDNPGYGLYIFGS